MPVFFCVRTHQSERVQGFDPIHERESEREPAPSYYEPSLRPAAPSNGLTVAVQSNLLCLGQGETLRTCEY